MVSDPGIAFITPWLVSGGIERTIEVKAPWFAARGYRTHVVAWTIADTLSGYPNPVLTVCQQAGVTVHRWETGGRLELLRHAARLAWLAHRKRLSVVVGHELLANVVVLLAKLLSGRRFRAVVQVHNEPATYAPSGASPRLLALTRLLLPLADATVAVSADLQRHHAKFFGALESRVDLVYNPFPLAHVRRLAQAPADLPGTGPYIVACGRLTEIKGFTDLIDAFALVRRRVPLRLVILGDGPDREKLIRRAEAHGVADDLFLPGFVPNPFAYFARARCFVLSSRHEGLANVVLEAMAAGTPIITSRCGGIEEVIEPGRSGLVVEAGDVEGFASAILDLVSNPCRAAALASAATARVEEFAHERVLPALERVYFGVDDPGHAARFPGTRAPIGKTGITAA
jgi:glycosyltransferase involved in cell wall biosynthesis